MRLGGRLLLLALGGLALLMAGCTSDDDDDSTEDATEDTDEEATDEDSSDEASTDEVEEYAEGFCASFGTWAEDYAAAFEALLGMGQVDPGDPVAQQEALDSAATALDDAAAATGELIGALDELGVPDIEDGADFHEEFVSHMADGQDLFEEFASTIRDLDVASATPTELQEFAAASDDFRTQSQAIGDALRAVDDAPDEFEDAAEDIEECQDLEGRLAELEETFAGAGAGDSSG